MNYGWMWARFLARWVLGLSFFMTGWMEAFQIGPTEFARRFFVETYAGTWIPAPLLWVTGTCVPWIELIGGAFLCLGLFSTFTSVILGGLLVVVTYGQLLHDPTFDVMGRVFPRLALILFVLVSPKDDDRLSLDWWWMWKRPREDGDSAGTGPTGA